MSERYEDIPNRLNHAIVDPVIGGNYRPVSLTNVCCKILEQLIRDHMMDYLLGNGLISDKQ